MEETDEAARDLGLSRARLSEQLDQAYADEPAKGEQLLVWKLKTKLPAQDRW